MFDGIFVIKIAAVLAVTFVIPSTYIAYNNGYLTKPFTFPRKEDCDYKTDDAEPCSLALNKTQCIYYPKYCYLNIWNLAKKFREEHPEELQHMYAVFISSSSRVLYSWMHVRGYGRSSLMCLDYHVVLVYSRGKRSWVFDFDSKLPFPDDLQSYCRETYRIKTEHFKGLQPLFRVIRADVYLNTFDPMRDGVMLRRVEDSPIYKYIKIEPEKHYSEKYGEVLDRFEFIKKFS